MAKQGASGSGGRPAPRAAARAPRRRARRLGQSDTPVDAAREQCQGFS